MNEIMDKLYDDGLQDDFTKDHAFTWDFIALLYLIQKLEICYE